MPCGWPRWDGVASLTGWPTAGDTLRAEWQRAKQYRGDHVETWCGVAIDVDSDLVKGPVATVARTFRVTSSTPLNIRSAPTTSSSLLGQLAPGAAVSVICQARGQLVGSTRVWDRISTGGYVSDRYVSTPSSTGFSTGLPVCSYPGQVTSSSPVEPAPRRALGQRLLRLEQVEHDVQLAGAAVPVSGVPAGARPGRRPDGATPGAPRAAAVSPWRAPC